MNDTNPSRRRWSSIAALLPLIVVILAAAARAGQQQPQPPPGFHLVARAELSQGPFDEVVLAHLSLSETTTLRLRLTMRQIDTTSLDLRLQAEGDVRHTVMYAEGLRTSREGGADWEKSLPAGAYRLVLSAAQSPGSLEIYAADATGQWTAQPAPSRALLAKPIAAAPILTTEEAQLFFNTILLQQLERYHIPGAAVAVVQDGQILFAEGYGYADLEQQLPVNAAHTLFRTGSVAKLFTWTAVMQLVEQGRLDLHADVNSYLRDFRIPATFPQPITLAHLLTHTAGFEDRSFGALRAQPDDLEPLGTYLARSMPARVYPPGQVSAYSNYATALSGLIVEQVTGQSYAEYIQRHIFAPLEMAHTTLDQPVTSPLATNLATGYVYTDGALHAQPFEILQFTPAGSASASATDMAHFMIAHLEDGTYADARILQAATADMMHSRQFSNAPELAGVAYGFYELHINQQRLLTHAGETSFFRSQIFLLPDEHLGLYIVYNAPGGGTARMELAQAFFDHFYPLPEASIPPLANGTVAPEFQHAGRYIPTRSSQTTLEKLRLLFDPVFQPLTVRVGTDGGVEIEHPLARSRNPDTYQPQRLVALAAGYYQSVDGRDQALFRSDAQGNQMLFLDSVPVRGHRKLAGYETLFYQPLVPAGLLLVPLVVMVFAMIDRSSPLVVRRLMSVNAALLLLFLVGLVAFGLFGFMAYIYGNLSPLWWIVFALPIVLIPLSIGLAVRSMWPQSTWRLARRMPYALAALAIIMLLVWAHYWNLLGWHL